MRVKFRYILLQWLLLDEMRPVNRDWLLLPGL